MLQLFFQPPAGLPFGSGSNSQAPLPLTFDLHTGKKLPFFFNSKASQLQDVTHANIKACFAFWDRKGCQTAWKTHKLGFPATGYEYMTLILPV